MSVPKVDLPTYGVGFMVYVAQLAECLIVIQEVMGSIPIIHTTYTSMVLTVASRSPKPKVRVRILVGVQIRTGSSVGRALD